MTCTRCEGTGFLNFEQVPEGILSHNRDEVMQWITDHPDTDVTICDCCGNGEAWHGEPGLHDSKDYGRGGPYAYNGGLPECH